MGGAAIALSNAHLATTRPFLWRPAGLLPKLAILRWGPAAGSAIPAASATATAGGWPLPDELPWHGVRPGLCQRFTRRDVQTRLCEHTPHLLEFVAEAPPVWLSQG